MAIQKIRYKTTLKQELAKGLTPRHIGKMLGLTSHAIRAMIASNRHVMMVEKKGEWYYTEVKPWRCSADNRGNVAGRPKIGVNPDFTEDP